MFAHFGSREDLQVEVVREYHRRFEDEVFSPSLHELRGSAAFARDDARAGWRSAFRK